MVVQHEKGKALVEMSFPLLGVTCPRQIEILSSLCGLISLFLGVKHFSISKQKKILLNLNYG